MKPITAVPESITREVYLELVTACGFDPTSVKSMELRVDGIYAEVYQTNIDTGASLVDVDTNEPIVDRVWIPVRD